VIADGETQERFVDVVATFPSDAKPAEAVEPGDGALDDPAEDVQAGAVRLASFGDRGPDAALSQEPPVLVVVVAAVGEQSIWASPWPADDAGDRWDLVQQGRQLGDVVAVSTGQRHRERDSLSVREDVVLAARPCAVDRARTAFGPRRAARTWEESITARDRMGGIPRTSGSRPRLSCMLAPEMPSDSGTPLRSVIRWIFDPGLPRSVGFGPVSGPLLPPEC
jgi:hypothetical protein